MTTEPGCIPKAYDKVVYKKLAPELQQAVKAFQYTVADEIRNPAKVDDTPKPPSPDYNQPADVVNKMIEASKSLFS